MTHISSFTFREAVAVVEYKGYLVPKGWKVMPLFRNLHHSPEFFPYPQKFDPSACSIDNQRIIVIIFTAQKISEHSWVQGEFQISKHPLCLEAKTTFGFCE